MIRTAFIYKPDTRRAGSAQSEILVGAAAFDNAREPLAQAFKPEGAAGRRGVRRRSSTTSSPRARRRNPDNTDTGDGQGAFNGDRVRQATALVDLRRRRSPPTRGTDAVFLTGDFNSYT